MEVYDKALNAKQRAKSNRANRPVNNVGCKRIIDLPNAFVFGQSVSDCGVAVDNQGLKWNTISHDSRSSFSSRRRRISSCDALMSVFLSARSASRMFKCSKGDSSL